jgi:hypothetical protein
MFFRAVAVDKRQRLLQFYKYNEYWGFSFKLTVRGHRPLCRRTLVAVTRHSGPCRTCHWSRQGQNGLDAKKRKFFVGNVEIPGVSRQILAGVEMSNLKKGPHFTPPVDLNENPVGGR